ncbi:hypothetical protein WBG78_15925 [Chryseolinea sp. T2]|uniref:hypothetical protein n=1 Tax=Chryseolinea sp. T2 TaxID=3129255 RepID=UPI0030777679
MKRLLIVFALFAVVGLASGFQLIKTTLSVTVRDEVGNTVEGAKVRLFENEEDYKSEQHMAVEGVTDAKGLVKFKDLKAIGYFVIAEKGDLDNSGGGEKTAKLEEKKVNKVTIIIQ